MTSLVPARRRVAEFASLVDGGGDHLTGADGLAPSESRFADLLVLVTTLRETPRVEPRPGFVADLRDRLMVEAETALLPLEVERTLPVRRHGTRDRRLAAAAAALVLVGGSASMAAASRDALPGEALYPIKRAIENAQTVLSFSDAARAADLIDSATERLDEVTALSTIDSPAGDAQVPTTLEEFSTQAQEAAGLLLTAYAETGDEQRIVELREFTADSMSRLVALEQIVPVDARDELTDAAIDLGAIDARATEACPTCSGGIVELPGVFLDQVGLGLDATNPIPDEAIDRGTATTNNPPAPGLPPEDGLQGPGTTDSGADSGIDLGEDQQDGPSTDPLGADTPSAPSAPATDVPGDNPAPAPRPPDPPDADLPDADLPGTNPTPAPRPPDPPDTDLPGENPPDLPDPPDAPDLPDPPDAPDLPDPPDAPDLPDPPELPDTDLPDAGLTQIP